MKYDVDLQEIDAIRRARNVYEEESASGRRDVKKNARGRGKEVKKKGKKEKGRERKYTRVIIMLPTPRARAVCLEEKSESLLKHNFERLSTGSPVLSSNGKSHHNIVRPREVTLSWLLSLSLSLSSSSERP